MKKNTSLIKFEIQFSLDSAVDLNLLRNLEVAFINEIIKENIAIEDCNIKLSVLKENKLF